jgi:hypothetical protein
LGDRRIGTIDGDNPAEATLTPAGGGQDALDLGRDRVRVKSRPVRADPLLSEAGMFGGKPVGTRDGTSPDPVQLLLVQLPFRQAR